MSNEIKIANAIADLTENHWFNPAVLGRMLADQPIYTVDRVMEMVAQILHYQNQKYEAENQNGRTSEGLFLAKELNNQLKIAKTKYKFNNLSLPK